jgi:hypothetical protein
VSNAAVPSSVTREPSTVNIARRQLSKGQQAMIAAKAFSEN